MYVRCTTFFHSLSKLEKNGNLGGETKLNIGFKISVLNKSCRNIY